MRIVCYLNEGARNVRRRIQNQRHVIVRTCNYILWYICIYLHTHKNPL